MQRFSSVPRQARCISTDLPLSRGNIFAREVRQASSARASTASRCPVQFKAKVPSRNTKYTRRTRADTEGRQQTNLRQVPLSCLSSRRRALFIRFARAPALSLFVKARRGKRGGGGRIYRRTVNSRVRGIRPREKERTMKGNEETR